MSAAMKHGFTEAADAVLAGIELIRQDAPEAMKAFGGLALAATATRAVDTKTKELMALAISIAVHCEGCVAYHARAAFKHGATRQELAETVALAVYMGGGPAAVFGGDAMRAYDEFARGAGDASADATGR